MDLRGPVHDRIDRHGVHVKYITIIPLGSMPCAFMPSTSGKSRRAIELSETTRLMEIEGLIRNKYVLNIWFLSHFIAADRLQRKSYRFVNLNLLTIFMGSKIS